MSTDDHTDPRTDDIENISFSATELDDIVNSAEITEENVADDDLEEYGVWVKVGPEDVTESADDLPPAENDAPLTDLDDAEEDFLTGEEESLLGDVDGESKEGGDAVASAGESGDVLGTVEDTLGADADLDLDIPDVEDLVEGEEGEEEPELDTDFELAEVKSAASAEEPSFDVSPEDVAGDDIEVPLTDETKSESGELADLADLGDDDTVSLAIDSTPPQPTSDGDASTASLLAKMERELLAIMEEITDVKRELGELRKSDISSSEPKTEPTGFFDGDDDETIALTGDELDDILSSADITEEIAEPEDAPAPLEIDVVGDTAEGDAGFGGDDALGTDVDLGLDLGLEGEDAEVDLGAGEAAAPEVDLEIGDIGGEDDAVDSLIDGEDLIGADKLDDTDADVADEGADLEVGLDASEAEPAPAVDEFGLDADAGAEDLLLEEEPDAGQPEELVLDEEPLATIELDDEIAGADDALELVEELETDEPDIELVPAAEAAEVEDVDLSIDGEDQPLELADEQPLDLEETGARDDGTVLEIEEVADEAATDISAELPDEHRGDAGTITLEGADAAVPDDLKQDIKSVLAYLDQLLDALPEEKIEEFAQSEHFGVYKKLFEKLGLED